MRRLLILIVSMFVVNIYSQEVVTGIVEDWSLKRTTINNNFTEIFGRIQDNSTVFISDSTTSDLEIQTLINNNSKVSIANGTYLVDTTWLIPSNFHLEILPNATIKLANGANKHLFHNAGLGIDGLGEIPDSNIIIDGGGRFDGNKTNQTRTTYVPGSNYNWELFWLNNVTNLKFIDLELKEARTFSSRFSDIHDFVIENIFINQITVENNGDGIHINGPATNGIIRNVWGSSADDDFLAIIPDDAPLATWGYVGVGDISNITIDNISPDSNTTETLRSVTGLHSLDNIAYRGINSHVKDQFMLFGNNGETETGVYKTIKLFNTVSKTDKLTVWCGTYFADTVENLYVDNFTISHGSGFFMQTTKTESVHLKDITFKDIDTSLTFITDFQITADIDDIVIENLRYTYSGVGDRLAIVGIEGSGERVLIKDSKMNRGRNIFRKTSTSDTITTVIIQNCDLTNGRTGEPIIAASFVENLIIENCRIRNVAKIIDQVSIKNLTISNCIIDSISTMINSGANAYDSVYLKMINNTIIRIQARPFRMFSNTSNKYWFITSSGNKLQYDGAFENDPLYSDTPTFSKISWNSTDFVINTTYINNPQEGDNGIFISGGFKVPAYYSNGNWYNLITGTIL